MAFLGGWFITVVLSGIVLWLWKLHRCHWTYRIIKMVDRIPGPRQIPGLGNIYEFVGSPEHVWKVTRKYMLKYNGVLKTWSANRCAVLISNPNDFEILLSSTTEIEKSELYRSFQRWLGLGLLTSGGNKWKSRRKILTPAFHFNILKEFVDIFEKHSVETMEILAHECEKSFTDVIPIITHFSLYSLCETTMGISVENNPSIISYKKAIIKFGDLFLYRLLKPWLYSDFVFDLTPFGREMGKSISVLHKFTKDVIDERLRNWDPMKLWKVETASGKSRMAMLDLLITQMKEGSDIDYAGLCEEVDTFMFEGHDTTSMALSFCLMLLANHPEYQEKIYKEQVEIFGQDTQRKGTYDELQSMHYLEQCIKESLRLYPAVTTISRHLKEDLKLENYVLPAGIFVHMLIYDLHHNPRVWPDPEKFDPERFNIENTAKRHPFAYVPFSAGSRNCIGQRFALLEMKSLISHLSRKYILEPIDTPETLTMKTDIVIRPSGEIRVKFRKRI